MIFKYSNLVVIKLSPCLTLYLKYRRKLVLLSLEDYKLWYQKVAFIMNANEDSGISSAIYYVAKSL